VSQPLAIEVDDLDVFYKDFQALWKVSLKVREGEIVSVIGANGSGKSTLFNTIAGINKPAHGSIQYLGKRIDGLPAYQILGLGISLVPEGRRVFARLTVHENLVMGAYFHRSRFNEKNSLPKVYDLFPVLEARRNQLANTLSGGEQQMLAIGRALMSEPRLILCDEISLGLAPLIIEDIYERLRKIHAQGVTIVLVDQDIGRSLEAAHYAYVMLEGRVALEGEPASLGEEQVRKAYFGV
jgi:branched-chain amino acid transport system ATP-binding protein